MDNLRRFIRILSFSKEIINTYSHLIEEVKKYNNDANISNTFFAAKLINENKDYYPMADEVCIVKDISEPSDENMKLETLFRKSYDDRCIIKARNLHLELDVNIIFSKDIGITLLFLIKNKTKVILTIDYKFDRYSLGMCDNDERIERIGISRILELDLNQDSTIEDLKEKLTLYVLENGNIPDILL